MRIYKCIYKLLIIIFIFSLFINFTYLRAFAITQNFNNEYNKPYVIVIDLNESKLFLIKTNSSEIVKTYIITPGKPSTPSPVGIWTIVDKEMWSGGFGTRWMALNVPWGKYGIHGTNKPSIIGQHASHGCIRMHNRDVEDLYEKVSCGTSVMIYGGPYGLMYNHFRTLVPGNTGSDVFEVQQKLKNIGYYPYNIDGKYGEAMKSSIMKFRKDNNLKISHNIDYEVYKLLGILPFE